MLLMIPLLSGLPGAARAQGLSTTTILTATPDPSILGAAVTLTATVSSPSASPASINGLVTFYDGVTPLSVGMVHSGTASLQTNLLSAGMHSMWVLYAGNAVYGRSRSASASLTVNAQPGTGFKVATTFPAGTGPQSVAIADLNGDGKADLAVANNNSNNVSVLLGNGNGTFQAAVNYAVGSSPTSVTVGDFNGDGKTDLAVANELQQQRERAAGQRRRHLPSRRSTTPPAATQIPSRWAISTATARPTWPWQQPERQRRERAAGQRQRHLPDRGQLRRRQQPRFRHGGRFQRRRQDRPGRGQRSAATT